MFCNTFSIFFVPPASYKASPIQPYMERFLGAKAEVESGAEVDAGWVSLVGFVFAIFLFI
jgi:hypothetical protein